MSNQKPIADSKRLQTIIDLLQTSGNKLSKVLGYKSPASVYHVLEGMNNLSSGMIERIVKEFPQVNYLYLKTGQGEPILTDKAKQTAQQNLFGSLVKPDNEQDQINKALNIPSSTDPLTYNPAAQLQAIIDSNRRTNQLLEKLLESQKELTEALLSNH
jgi:ABC-type amino acid transport substrate-binding protein